MRIVHVVWSMTAGGLESMLLDICRHQSRAHQVYIVVVNAQYDVTLARSFPGEYTVHRIERPVGSRNPWYLAKLLLRLFILRPDIIHLHQLSLMNVLRRVSAPMVATVHDTKFDLPHRTDRFRRVICISAAVERAVKKVLPNVVTEIVYNGVCAANVTRGGRRARGEFRIVQVSRLVHEKKGQDLLLRALRLLNDRYGELRLQVDFMGGGPSLNYLHGMAANLGLMNHVRFLGEISRAEIYATLGCYDLLVQPSRYEGFGLTVVEAMMADVPVLVSNIEGPLEIIEGGRYGDFFSSGDEMDLAEKIAVVAHRAPLEMARRRASARQYALKNFELARTAERYCAVYEDCLAEGI